METRTLKGRVGQAIALSCALGAGAVADAARADRIVFLREDGVWTANSDGGVRRRVAGSDGWNNAYPALSPDGSRVVCFSFRRPSGQNYEDGLFLLDVRTGARRRLTPRGIANIGEPAWSRDGRRIVFRGSRTANNAISIINADGSGLRQLTEALNNFSPSWGPDGQTIAYSSFQPRGGTEYKPAITFLNLETGALRQVPLPFDGEKLSVAQDLEWSRDGLFFAFSVLDKSNSNREIFRVNANGSGLRRLTFGSNLEYNPTISPDGRSILFSYFSARQPLDLPLRLMYPNGQNSRAWLGAIGGGFMANWSSAPEVAGTAPAVTILSPASNAVQRTISSIEGLVTDADEVSGVLLSVTLRAPDGRYWNGHAFQSELAFVPTQRERVGTQNTINRYGWSVPEIWLPSRWLPAGLPEGLYRIEATVRDETRLTSRTQATVRISNPSAPAA